MIQGFILLLSSLLSLQATAFSWRDLWTTPDQQGQFLMEQGQFAKAKEVFELSDWAAAAAYKAGDYEKAAELFEKLQSQSGYYNQGNALAHLGRYESAIDAYNKALKINPDDQDAIYNLKIIKDLLKKNQQNKEQQNKEQQNKEQQNKEEQNKEQQNKEQQNKEQQNKEQQNKEQQNKEQQNKEQQNKEQQNKEQQNKEQQNKEQQNKEQQNKEQQQQESQHNKGSKKVQGQTEAEREKQQANEQWLRLIPDDPGGLIREKFLRDHLRRARGWYQ